jgi:hypothetical protein
MKCPKLNAVGVLSAPHCIQQHNHLDVIEMSCENTFEGHPISYLVVLCDCTRHWSPHSIHTIVESRWDQMRCRHPDDTEACQDKPLPCQSELTHLLGPHPGDSCGSVQRSCSTTQQKTHDIKGFEVQTLPVQCKWVKSCNIAKVKESIHINPSVPSWQDIRFIIWISLSVMLSLLERPPCVTKFRLTPSGERIVFCILAGGHITLTRVARGTKLTVSRNHMQNRW